MLLIETVVYTQLVGNVLSFIVSRFYIIITLLEKVYSIGLFTLFLADE